ncbi:DMT family transporter [Clostridium sp. JS66]|uniref:DMT family transporter n=1 Tax=Clostridium sp. JS66 TaxID=3064705 RepID=UPI00298DF411|nr:DMT family transporter [Clostridium sp. JS66]WPC42259.1 DMT family transporter [Clostridium sp. JS66]
MEKVRGDSKKSFWADMSLFLTALLWGGGFVAVKDAVSNVTPFYMLAIRFLAASILLTAVFYKKFKGIRKQDIISGFIVGIFLFLSMSAQTIGIQYTTAGKQAFITTVYVVIIPFFVWAIDKKKPDTYSIVSVLLTFIGISFLSINSEFKLSMNLGDWITLFSAFLFAAHIVSIAHFTKDTNPIVLSVLQMSFAGIMSLVFALIFEGKFTGINNNALFSMFYIIIFSTTIPFLIQNVAQKYTHPNHVGIILSFESVFGAILSVIFLKDIFTINMIVGCIIIFIAVIICETKLSFLKNSKKNDL